MSLYHISVYLSLPYICLSKTKEGNVLFNDALNTFHSTVIWRRTYGKGPLRYHMHHPTDRIAHTTVFLKPVLEHWLEREIAQWVHPMKDRTMSERSYHGATSRSCLS